MTGRTHIAHTMPRRPRYAARGQALIMAVLIMFLLAGLGGLFVATLNQALVQTARAEERQKLEEITDAGLQHATNHLLYSPDGSWWRPDAGPDPNNAGWLAYGGGFYRITLTYGPSEKLPISAAHPMAENPLQRYLKIDVEARFALDNMPDPKLREALDPLDPAKKDDASTFDLYKKGYLDPRRYLTRRRTAFVPIGLTDYLRWITNDAGSTEPAVLGPDVDLNIVSTKLDPNDIAVTDAQLRDPANNTTVACTYRELHSGPIRCEGDLQLGSGIRIDLTEDTQTTVLATRYKDRFAVVRNDGVEVTGSYSDYNADSTALTARILLNSMNAAIGTANTALVLDPMKDRANATRLRLLQTRESNPLIRPMKAPRIDRRDPATNLHRYRALTADSARVDYLADPTASASGVPFSSQMLGWGNGLYLDEKYTGVQHGGNLPALQYEWLNPKDPASDGLTWINGVYHPENAGAVEITLHDWEVNAAGQAIRLPYLELRRADGGQFYDRTNQPIGERCTLPYPRNGVIYAEGNLVVKGNLPASLAFHDGDGDGLYEPVLDTAGVQRPGGWEPDDSGISYYVTAANRRYDLSVVSNGTLYIDGNLLGPATRHATYVSGVGTAPILSGSEWDSKIGLLARDNVALNPTKVFSSASRETELVGDEQLWRIRTNDPLDFTFSTAGAWGPRTRLLLRHGGAAVIGQPDYGVIRMTVNSESFLFANPTDYPDSGIPYAYRDRLCFGDLLTLDSRTPWWTYFDPARPQWGGGLYANDPLEQQFYEIGNAKYYTSGATPLLGFGAMNTIRFEWMEGCDYLLAASKTMPTVAVTGVDVQVDALVYAQRGSWFIIPGVFYNDPENPTPDLEWPFPKPGEPLDVRLVFHGAIVENRPAPVEAQEAWITHWRGSDLAYYAKGDILDPKSGTVLPNQLDPGADPASFDDTLWRWTKRRAGIEYYYDATLMRPVCYQDGVNARYFSPRLPKLPVCPSVFSIGVMQNT